MAKSGYTSLVIGGTGMLASATRWLAARSALTLVVARNASRFIFPNDMGIRSLDANWTKSSFAGDIRSALDGMPPITHSLIWVHEPEIILAWLLPLLQGAKSVVVLGSIDSRPNVSLAGSDVAYVRLGSMATEAGRRWLTHQEISDAAVDALVDGKSREVGELMPIG